MKTARVLVAGIGNIFYGDDAFGVEVVRRLSERSLPPDVRVVDFGIRGIDLTYALLEDHEQVILVDALRRGGKPGTLYVIKPQVDDAAAMQTHELVPSKALAAAKAQGANLANVILVGCEPESFGSEECPQMGLSETAAACLGQAVNLIESLIVGGNIAANV